MRYSGIGGQAVMEGVMMKNQEKYAVAVRKPDQEIVVETSTYEGLIKNKKHADLAGRVQFYRIVGTGDEDTDVLGILFRGGRG